MINENARQRGRTIDFKDILYGYSRVNPLHGADYVLDLLLVYRKHKGRKMTVPVRRHAYLQQTFSDLQFRSVEVLVNDNCVIAISALSITTCPGFCQSCHGWAFYIQIREEVRENIVDTPTTETPRSFLKRVQEKLFPVMEEDAPFEDLGKNDEELHYFKLLRKELLDISDLSTNTFMTFIFNLQLNARNSHLPRRCTLSSLWPADTRLSRDS